MRLGPLLTAAAIIVALAAGAVFITVERLNGAAAARLAAARLSLLSATLTTTIDRFVAIPDLVGNSRQIAAVLTDPANPAARDQANRFLEQAAGTAGLSALFVVDGDGTAVAASNWRDAGSFVGHNYRFRPYFTAARDHGRGRFYGVGVTTGIAGYFLSSRVALDETAPAAGVVVAKVDFTPLETSWTRAGDRVMVSDGDGIVFLTTDPALRYRPLQPLPAERLAAIAAEQRYATHAIGAPLTAVVTGGATATAIATAAVPGTAWHIAVAVTGDGTWQPVTAAALAVLIGLVLALAAAVLRQHWQRVRSERQAVITLEQRVTARTAELKGALDRLETEISERRRVDGELNRARHELVQAAKLAAMGRAFSGLAHEVNQPLAALRTYLASTRLLIDRGDTAAALRNIATMDSAIERLTGLTAQLKRLSRRSDDRRTTVDLAALVQGVADLLKFRLADAAVALTLTTTGPVAILADASRLEQVALNLLLNAIDAVSGQDDRRIMVTVDHQDGRAHLAVTDNGPGIAAADRDRLFEPFFTTKEVGVGLGLGLAISYAIVKDHGGTIHYERSAGDLTCFHIHLPGLPEPRGENSAP